MESAIRPGTYSSRGISNTRTTKLLNKICTYQPPQVIPSSDPATLQPHTPFPIIVYHSLTVHL